MLSFPMGRPFANAIALTLLAALPARAFAQVNVRVMFDGYDQDSPQLYGSTIVTRQGEHSGKGTAGANQTKHRVWLWDYAAYQFGSMAGRLNTNSPATQIDVFFKVDRVGASGLPLADVHDGIASDDHDVIIYYLSNQLLANGAGEYMITIDDDVPSSDPSTEVIVEAPVETGTPEADATWETIRMRITRVATGDANIARPSLGWHARRLLIEDGATSPANPGSVAIMDCSQNLANSMVCDEGICGTDDVRNIDIDDFVLQTGHSTHETSRRPMANNYCPGSTASAHCQMSTKIVAEGANPGSNTKYMGYRFQDRDQQGLASHTICGCGAVTDDEQFIYVELEVGGDATPAPNRTGFQEQNHDMGVSI